MGKTRIGIMFAAAIIATIGFVVLSHTAQASGQSLSYSNDEDVVMYISERLTGTATSFDILMQRYADLNSDGDMADALELVSILSVSEIVNCTGATPSAVVSCDVISLANEEMLLIWRNATTEHRTGNYSVSVTWRDNLGVLSVVRIGVRLFDPPITNACPSNCVQQHESTRTLVNQSYGNVSQNLTTIINTGVYCLNCSSVNETINHTVFRSSIATDCHNTGGDFCVNGHLANVSNDTLTGMALFLGIMLILSYAAIQGGYVFPSLAVFGSLFVILLMVAKIGIVFDNDYARVFSILIPLIPLAIGGFNLGAIVRGKGTPSPT